MRLILAFFLCLLPVLAQDTHSVTLNWEDGRNPAGVTYNVYRVLGLCSGSPAFSKIAEGVAVRTYLDTTVQPGPYCYVVTAVFSGIESAYSNSALGQVPNWEPQKLTATVK
jgi:hypothetical protein